jgi:prepilin-type N-terminal cleavage/methylation domain-containing protein
MSGGVKQIGFGQTGVTLVELLVVLAIIGIIVLVGVNVMGGVLAKHRVGAAAGDLTTRLRAAKILSVVNNRRVTIIFDAVNNTYHACLDSNTIGDCTEGGDDYLNLDSGRTGSYDKSEKTLHATLGMYNANFGDANPPSVTYTPPSGLPVNITSSGVFVNGVVCLRSEPGDEGDDWDARYTYRRVAVNPIVGKATLWRNLKSADGVTEADVNACSSDDTAWEKTF